MGAETRVIAIDGPSASGKSTVARRLAGQLGYVYVDSGSVYRGVTWEALRRGIDCRDTAKMEGLIGELEPAFYLDGHAVRFRIGGTDPGMEVRSQEVDRNVSPVAALPAVRVKVTGWLRAMTRFGNLVIEGRDIGTAVFPQAEHKFFLDASADVRAKRRYVELAGRDEAAHAEEVRKEILRRDSIDTRRKKDPLRPAEDAVRVDSTGMSVSEVVAVLREKIEGH